MKTTRRLPSLLLALILLLSLFSAMSVTASASDTAVYTLDGTKTDGTNNYTTESDITQDNIAWKVMGNTKMNPWRIGGKSLTEEDRPVYSLNPLNASVSKVDLVFGTMADITVHSVRLIVASDDSFTTVIDDQTITSVSANSTLTITPTNEAWTDAYYKFIFNVSVAKNFNYYIQLKSVTFYGEATEQGGGQQTNPDQAAADTVIGKISAIGEVAYTSDCKNLIDDARSTYNALTETQQALVTNYTTLTDAETAYAALQTAAADQAAADTVIGKIGAIGEVAYTADSKGLIDDARSAYDALTETRQSLVTNYTTLTDAETAYAALKTAADDQAAADAVIGKISAIGEVAYTSASKNLIDDARSAYNALTETQQALVTNYTTLTNAEAAYADLKPVPSPGTDDNHRFGLWIALMAFAVCGSAVTVVLHKKKRSFDK